MINSVNSDSSYLTLLANNNLLNKLSETTKTNSEATSFKLPSDTSDQTSVSSIGGTNVSLEDHLRMMQSLQSQSVISTANTQSASTTDLSSLDLDGDGTISSDEYDSILSKMGITDAPSSKDFFAKVDTNSDGEISIDELKAQRPTGLPPTQAQSISSDIDLDSDGTVSTDEYDSAIAQMGITNAPSSKDFFAQVDTNSDGEISVDELKAQRPTGPPMGPPPTQAQSISSDIDLDSDGTISTDEYDSAIAQMGITDAPSSKDFFAQVDTNSDGEISVDELNAQKALASQATLAQSIASTIDLNGDGTISTDEYDSIVSKLGITDAPSSKDFFTQLDTNSDGKISVDELNAALNAAQATSAQSISNQSTSGQSLSDEFNAIAASMLNAYESNYQNMFNTDNTNLNSIA